MWPCHQNPDKPIFLALCQLENALLKKRGKKFKNVQKHYQISLYIEEHLAYQNVYNEEPDVF